MHLTGMPVSLFPHFMFLAALGTAALHISDLTKQQMLKLLTFSIVSVLAIKDIITGSAPR